jgi:hypothetical protein
MKTIRKEDVREILAPEKLLEGSYRFAFIQRIGSVYVGSIEEAGDLNPDEILEARFFDEEKELHVFKYDGKLEAVVTECEDGDEYFEEKQILRGKYGKTLTIHNYLVFDEKDGQARIGRTVFANYEGGGING